MQLSDERDHRLRENARPSQQDGSHFKNLDHAHDIIKVWYLGRSNRTDQRAIACQAKFLYVVITPEKLSNEGNNVPFMGYCGEKKCL
jgi:hypothetical protein